MVSELVVWTSHAPQQYFLDFNSILTKDFIHTQLDIHFLYFVKPERIENCFELIGWLLEILRYLSEYSAQSRDE